MTLTLVSVPTQWSASRPLYHACLVHLTQVCHDYRWSNLMIHRQNTRRDSSIIIIITISTRTGILHRQLRRQLQLQQRLVVEKRALVCSFANCCSNSNNSCSNSSQSLPRSPSSTHLRLNFQCPARHLLRLLARKHALRAQQRAAVANVLVRLLRRKSNKQQRRQQHSQRLWTQLPWSPCAPVALQQLWLLLEHRGASSSSSSRLPPAHRRNLTSEHRAL